ncbi:CLUMA_CG005950, isoform A [Clunio marinus]|uniref:CLUMA_CG005950, isoform A n=1 Tax=Clunio marinus TaxID=568069 RepID=A0A1J1HYF5_9DIPT|nr:CLUMA_CG005950, isoform A [Clunio marinus]
MKPVNTERDDTRSERLSQAVLFIQICNFIQSKKSSSFRKFKMCMSIPEKSNLVSKFDTHSIYSPNGR